MKPNVYLEIKIPKFTSWLNFGWYRGEDLKLFDLYFGEFLTDIKGKVDQITFFHIQIAHLIFATGISLY